MWNAGVIGIAAANTALFGPMIELTDALYGQYQKHIMEQLAVSYYLQQATEVRTADRVVWHYWAQKDELNPKIAEFLDRNRTLSDAAAGFASFPWPAQVEKSARKKSFSLFSLFKR
jgi:hypothetical protein